MNLKLSYHYLLFPKEIVIIHILNRQLNYVFAFKRKNMCLPNKSSLNESTVNKY